MAGTAAASRTIDGTSSMRCMAVALTEAQREACRLAIFPVELVRFATMKEACAAMSTVLPLIVAIDASDTTTNRDELYDLAAVCSAEVVEIEAAPNVHALVQRMATALQSAEQRRFKIA